MSLMTIRENRTVLPKSLGRRDLPILTPTDLTSRSFTFRTLEAAVARPGPRDPKIVSSAHGKIKHILLCYPTYADGEYSYKAVYEDLFRKLPGHVQYTILTHPSVVKELSDALTNAGVDARATIVEAPDFLQFLVWGEDPFVVVEDVSSTPSVNFFVEPYTFTRASDAAIADLIADVTPLQSIQSPLYFQGGNVLIGDKFFFIGADYPAKTLSLIQSSRHIIIPPGANPADFVKTLYQRTFDPRRELFYVGTKLPVPPEQSRPITVDGERWTEIIYAGTGTAQPIFHIDMFVSLTGTAASGKYRVLLGSPALADKILGRTPIAHSMYEIFDDIARNLEGMGFEVVRNPLPLTYVDDRERRERMWYFATANNCLVEIDGDLKNVWLPTYGHGSWNDLAAVDKENKRIWEGLGFTVHELSDFHPFAQNLGAVHCIKKYLSRG